MVLDKLMGLCCQNAVRNVDREQQASNRESQAKPGPDTNGFISVNLRGLRTFSIP